jgi:hypothetical protein
LFRVAWVKSQLDADEKEKFEADLAMTEHLAGFINPEGVARVQNSRKSAIRVSDSQFERTVAAISNKNKKADPNRAG